MVSRAMKSVVAESSAKPVRSEENGQAIHAREPTGLLAPAWQVVRLEDIDLDDRTFQYRLSRSVADVRRSLERDGQQEPVDLTGKPPHRVIDGFRSVAAANALGWPSIKAFLHPGISDKEAFRLAFKKNVVRKNLSAVEKANAMFLAQQLGIRKAELAEAFGLSEKQVGRHLALAEFPASIQAVLDGRTVTMAHARLLAAFQVRDAEAWAKRIEEERLDATRLRKALEKEVGRKRKGQPPRFVRIGARSIRVYPFRISESATTAERESAVRALEQAITAMRGWGS